MLAGRKSRASQGRFKTVLSWDPSSRRVDFGLPVSLPSAKPTPQVRFTPGKVWIIWAADLTRRWQIDIPAGQTTLVRLDLEPSGNLAEPQISRTPATSQ